MQPKQIRCPRCGKPALYSPENAFRPFCSERCKLIDLGNWADGKYGVPSEPANDVDLEDPQKDH